MSVGTVLDAKNNAENPTPIITRGDTQEVKTRSIPLAINVIKVDLIMLGNLSFTFSNNLQN